MQQYPELMGRLTIKIFVAIGKPDEHGRLNGQWRTLFTRYMLRDDVPATLEQFTLANPMFNNNHGEIDVSFVTCERFPL